MNKIIGKTEEEGIIILKENHIDYRVVRKNSIDYIITCDYIPERLNLEVDNGIITSFSKG